MNLRELFDSRMRSLGIYDLSKGTRSLVCCENRKLSACTGTFIWRDRMAEEKCSGIKRAVTERWRAPRERLAIPVKQGQISRRKAQRYCTE